MIRLIQDRWFTPIYLEQIFYILPLQIFVYEIQLCGDIFFSDFLEARDKVSLAFEISIFLRIYFWGNVLLEASSFFLDLRDIDLPFWAIPLCSEFHSKPRRFMIWLWGAFSDILSTRGLVIYPGYELTTILLPVAACMLVCSAFVARGQVSPVPLSLCD